MIKHVLHLALCLGLVFGAVPLDALAKTDIETTTVSRVYVNTSGDVLVRFASGQGGEGCSSNEWARIDTARAQWERLFDVVLSAKLSGKPVGVRLSGCAYYPRITYVFIK